MILCHQSNRRCYHFESLIILLCYFKVLVLQWLIIVVYSSITQGKSLHSYCSSQLGYLSLCVVCFSSNVSSSGQIISTLSFASSLGLVRQLLVVVISSLGNYSTWVEVNNPERIYSIKRVSNQILVYKICLLLTTYCGYLTVKASARSTYRLSITHWTSRHLFLAPKYNKSRQLP